MKAGDLMYCTFSIGGWCTILEKKQHMFWYILWNGKTTLMHEDHMVKL